MTVSLEDITKDLQVIKDMLFDIEDKLAIDRAADANSEQSTRRVFDVTLRLATDTGNWGNGLVDRKNIWNMIETELPAIAEVISFEDEGDSVELFNVVEIKNEG